MMEDQIKAEFLRVGGGSYTDAIQALEKLGYTSIDAEELVSEWAEDAEIEAANEF